MTAELDRLYARYWEIRSYIGFEATDEECLCSLRPIVEPHFAAIIDDFYSAIQARPAVSQAITGGEAQIQRLKGTMRAWLTELFTGLYEIDYVARRYRAGMRHVDLGVDQLYTNAGMSRIRAGLLTAIGYELRDTPQRIPICIQSINKALDLDLAIIETAYREGYISRIRDVEAHYQQLVESLPLGVFRKDSAGRYAFVNQRFCRDNETAPDQFIGKSDRELFPEEMVARHFQDEDRVLRDGDVLEDIEEHSRADGTTSIFQTLKAPLRSSTGDIIGIQGVSLDITARRRAEEALRRTDERFRNLVDSNVIGIIIADFDGSIHEANDAYLNIVGYAREDLTNGNLRWDQITPDEYKELSAQAIDRVRREGKCPPWEKEYLRKDGSRVWVTLGASSMETSNRCICFVLDISAQKAAEIQLQRAKEAADDANQAKSAFLANMSHEIRTPMNAIIGMSDLLLDTSLNAEQHEYLHIVHNSAESLLALINDILDFSKIEAGKLELDCVDFSPADCIFSTLNSLSVSAHNKSLELIGEVDPNLPRVSGDPVRFRQILVNLVGNAIKFTNSGEIIVSANVDSRDDDHVMLKVSVRDTGIGIPSRVHTHIFRAFEQLDGSIARRFGGTGLGLAICSKLLRLMGGKIWFESEHGEGTVFHFTASFKIAGDREVQEDAEEMERHITTLRSQSVLLVEDNPATARVVEQMLCRLQMLPVVASDASSALEILKAGRAFSWALVDAQLPNIDGCGLAQQIRGQFAGQVQSLGFLLSPGSSPNELAKHNDVTADVLLAKPVSPTELMRKLADPVSNNGKSAEKGTATSSSETNGPLRILLAEDQHYNQILACRILEQDGHRVTIANNGSEAIRLSDAADFDLILMDVQMPELDGLEATRRIRAREKTSGTHVPIVAMTAQAMHGDCEACLAAGMDAYLVKPVRPAMLRETLASFQAGPVQKFPTQMSPVAAELKVSPPAVARRTAATGDEPETDDIDWPTALRTVSGDVGLLKRVVEAFLAELPELLTRLELAFEQDDCKSLRLAAHGIKGAMRTFGAGRAFRLARRLEIMGIGEAGGILDELKNEMLSLKVQLADFTRGTDTHG